MDHWKKNKELGIGILFLVIGIVYFASAFSIPEYAGYGGQNISSSFLPKVLGIMLIALSAAQILLNRKKSTPAPGDEEVDPDEMDGLRGGSLKSLALIFGILVAYLALMPRLGFILSTVGFLFGSMMLLTPENKRNIPFAAVLSVAVATGVYFLFVKGLYLVLPAGILG